MHEEVELVPRAKQCPVLIDKIREEWLAVAEVRDILNTEDIDVFSIDLHGLGLLLAFLLLPLLLLCEQGLSLHGVLPLTLPLAPLLNRLLPGSPLLLEPGAWLEVVHTLGELLVQHPLLEQLGTGCLVLPFEIDAVEALLFGRQGEAGVGLGKGLLSEVRQVHLSESELLLLVCQLNSDIFFNLCILLLLLLLGFFLCLLVDLLTGLLLRRCLLGLPCFFGLLLFLLKKPLPLLLLGLLFPLSQNLSLFVLHHNTLDTALELAVWLAHDHSG
mmetsp:Transcript_47709/g.107374  ORF Transcript_47709/g.107374 Transcript_47709/m.107374 type:complete len:272 (-) Transcript_47709:1113-1928(-)